MHVIVYHQQVYRLTLLRINRDHSPLTTTTTLFTRESMTCKAFRIQTTKAKPPAIPKYKSLETRTQHRSLLFLFLLIRSIDQPNSNIKSRYHFPRRWTHNPRTCKLQLALSQVSAGRVRGYNQISSIAYQTIKSLQPNHKVPASATKPSLTHSHWSSLTSDTYQLGSGD